MRTTNPASIIAGKRPALLSRLEAAALAGVGGWLASVVALIIVTR